jgi:ubiquinone/menaquinone biosynthesis C-methylase UbiE
MGLFHNLVEWVSDQPALFIAIRGFLEDDFRHIRALVRRELRLGQGRRTLELACGPGTFFDLFAGEQAVGVDLNARYIAYAKAHYPGTFIHGDARKLDLPEKSFDQILIFGLLHHLADEDARAVLSECARLVTDDGRVLVIEDIPAVSSLNLVGHLIHAAENGHHIRKADEYRALYTERFRVASEETLRSGICDYYSAVLAH